jgi:hypothetical protein
VLPPSETKSQKEGGHALLPPLRRRSLVSRGVSFPEGGSRFPTGGRFLRGGCRGITTGLMTGRNLPSKIFSLRSWPDTANDRYFFATFFATFPRHHTVKPWYRPAVGNALVEFLNVMLTDDAEQLRSDTVARAAFLDLIALLASNQVPAALALQERARSAFSNG